MRLYWGQRCLCEQRWRRWHDTPDCCRWWFYCVICLIKSERKQQLVRISNGANYILPDTEFLSFSVRLGLSSFARAILWSIAILRLFSSLILVLENNGGWRRSGEMGWMHDRVEGDMIRRVKVMEVVGWDSRVNTLVLCCCFSGSWELEVLPLVEEQMIPTIQLSHICCLTWKQKGLLLTRPHFYSYGRAFVRPFIVWFCQNGILKIGIWLC